MWETNTTAQSTEVLIGTTYAGAAVMQTNLDHCCAVGKAWTCYYRASKISHVTDGYYEVTGWLVASIICFVLFGGMTVVGVVGW